MVEPPSAQAPQSAPAAAPQAVPPGYVWERLKQHKVLQWGLAYAGAALAIAHGQELLAAAYEWPHAIGRVVITLLVIGLPIALTFAWYHGHRGLRNFSAPEATIIALLFLISGILLTAFVRPAGHEVSRSGTVVPAHSVAVLPFVNLSADREQEYFADGLSEEILDSLARIQELQVVARTSSFSFKGKSENLKLIGEALGVKNILEGSVRKAGRQLRITAQLNDAVTGYHLWSQTYDRPQDDIFAVQEDIAHSVAQALEVTLGVGAFAQLPGFTRNVDAYSAFLSGTGLLRVYTTQSLPRSVEQLERATAFDPSFARAWVALSSAYAGMANYAAVESAEAWLAKARAAVAEAERLAPDTYYVQLTRSGSSAVRYHWVEAARELDQAADAARRQGADIEVDRGTFLLGVGRIKEAIPLLERERTRDPLNPLLSVYLATAYSAAGKPSAANAEIDRGLQLKGGFRILLTGDAMLDALASGDHHLIDQQIDVHLREVAATGTSGSDADDLTAAMRPLLDRPEEALAELRRRAQHSQSALGLTVSAYWLAYFRAPDDALKTLDQIRRLGLVITDPMMLWRPMLRDVRRQAGFKDLVRQTGLVDYWRAYGWADFCRPVGTQDFECS
jgi:TolB-like protein